VGYRQRGWVAEVRDQGARGRGDAGAAAIGAILWLVRGMAAPGDISTALTQHPEEYTLSLGHMSDLTLAAFAYLKTPLALAGLAFAIGAAGAWRWNKRRGPARCGR